MLSLIRNNKWFELSFVRLLVVALFVHVLFLLCFVLKTEENSEQYRVNVVFWGSILRKKDLAPQMFAIKTDITEAAFFSSSELLKSQGDKGWRQGFIVDKPVSAQEMDGKAGSLLPRKFLTERVEVEEAALEPVLGIPDLKRVPLKEPRE